MAHAPVCAASPPLATPCAPSASSRCGDPGSRMIAMRGLNDQNKSVVCRFGEALNHHDLDALDDLVTPDFMRHSQATPWIQIRSLEEFKRFLLDDWTGVPDARVTPRFLVAEGDLVAFFNTDAGTQTGQWGLELAFLCAKREHRLERLRCLLADV